MAVNTQRFMTSAWVSIVPSLAYTMHKGSCGRIAVVGGSSDYSGAPYFAAMAGMRAGADLAYVLCPPEAALAIKAYSPELCVRPLLTSNTMEECERVMKSCHAVILGPGIGDGTDEQRDTLLPRVVTAVRASGLPLVIDTSVMTFPKIVEALRSTAHGADVEAPTYLTPNGREVQLLMNAVLGEGEAEKYKAADDTGKRELAARVAHALRCVVMVKGHEDLVVDGWTTRGEPASSAPADLQWGTVCHVSGGRDPSPRRAAGQGDVLAGTLGCFAAWAKLAKHPSVNDSGSSASAGLVAPMLASLVVRDAARSAYDELHRSMVASDVLQRIGARFHAIDESLRKGQWPPYRL